MKLERETDGEAQKKLEREAHIQKGFMGIIWKTMM